MAVHPRRQYHITEGEMTMELTAFAKEELYILDNCDKLINGIYGYKYKENAVDDSIDRKDDDECDALRYAYCSEKIYMNNNYIGG